MIALIWAQAADRVIGRDGAIPWHLPEDLRNFRTLTTGSAVLMGRRTWESLPEQFRPLPDRRNLVLTRDPAWQSAGAERVDAIETAREIAAPADLWVIGGGEVYAAALPVAERLVVTDVDATYDGDTRAPAIGPEWRVEGVEPPVGWSQSTAGLRYRVTTYRR